MLASFIILLRNLRENVNLTRTVSRVKHKVSNISAKDYPIYIIYNNHIHTHTRARAQSSRFSIDGVDKRKLMNGRSVLVYLTDILIFSFFSSAS